MKIIVDRLVFVGINSSLSHIFPALRNFRSTFLVYCQFLRLTIKSVNVYRRLVARQMKMHFFHHDTKKKNYEIIIKSIYS